MRRVRALSVASSLLLSLAVGGCSEPLAPQGAIAGRHGVYVLCEGLWGQNNATLSRIELPDGRLILDVLAGTGMQLGDVGNDLKLRGDTLYVVVSGSRSIECFRASTAEWLGRIRLDNNLYPRQLCIVNDTLGLVTDLYGDAVTAVHLRQLRELPMRYAVGPAPEGIAAIGDYIVVANSGYGDYRAAEPKAGTLSVLSLSSGTEVATLPAGPNVVTVTVQPRRQRLYAVYLHRPSLWAADSLGGVVEYELPLLQRRRSWRLPISSYDVAWSPGGDTLLLLGTGGVWAIPTGEYGNTAPQLVWSNPTPQFDSWYTLAVDSSGELWIGNARTFTVSGEVLRIRPHVGLVQRFAVGLNPGAIVFF